MRTLVLSWTLLLVPMLALSRSPAADSDAAPLPRDGHLVAVTPTSPALPGHLFAEGAVPVRVLEGFVLAVADGDAISRLQAEGLAVERIAPLAGRGPWYTAEPADAAGLADLEPSVRVLHRRGPEVVFEASPEAALALADRGVDIARVFLRPVRLAGAVPPAPSAARRREIDFILRQAVDGVDADRIIATVQRLQDFGTRYATNDSCRAAADWIAAEMSACGIDSVSFHEWSTEYHPNVVGFVRGRSAPESVVVVGGHYDSAGGPGADDDASGVACMLECARVLSVQRYRKSIAFVAFCAEELGLFGSEAYAWDAAHRGENIVAMINLDMTGYCAPGDVPDLTVIANDASAWLLGRANEARADYAPGVVMSPLVINTARSDHASFWSHGFPAIWIFEDWVRYSPFIHGPQDVVGISVNSPLRIGRAAQLLAATVGRLAVPDRFPRGDAGKAGSAVVEARLVADGVVLSIDADPTSPITLGVYDIAGRRLVTLLRDEVVASRRSVHWDGRDAGGRPVPEGVYFVRLESAGRVHATRILLRRP